MKIGKHKQQRNFTNGIIRTSTAKMSKSMKEVLKAAPRRDEKIEALKSKVILVMRKHPNTSWWDGEIVSELNIGLEKIRTVLRILENENRIKVIRGKIGEANTYFKLVLK